MYCRIRHIISLIFLGMALTSTLSGQGSPDFSKPVKVTGSLGLSSGYYHAFGIANRRDPFSYLLSANINFNILGMVSIPFSANFSQQEASFRQPFNQYGISPNYKWITAHVGYRNLTFSDFSLVGHTFLGAGLELKPGKWNIAAMYGRFRRSVDEATALAEGVDPAFKRMGYGCKVGYADKGDEITFSALKVWDLQNSIPLPADNDQVSPQENLVLSLAFKKKIGRNFDFFMEVAQSALTNDTRSAEVEAPSSLAYFGPLFSQKASSQSNRAYKGGLNYKGKEFKVGLDYKRIDTDYRTLGAYFFNNDVEEATFKLTRKFFKGKVNFNGQIGGQRNNLLAQKATRSSRLIGAANVSFAPSPGLSFALNFSNFSSFLKVQQDILSDSLNFYQVTRNTVFNAVKVFGSEESRQSLGFTASYQTAVGRQEYSIDPTSQTSFINLALSHQAKLKAKDLGLTTAVSFAHSTMPASTTTFFGPVFGITKSFLNKQVKTSFRTSFQEVLLNGKGNSAVWTNALNGGYTFKEKHNFNLGFQFLRKMGQDGQTKSFSEFRGLFGYTFTFG